MTIPTSEQIKERPILFSTPMIRAILEGRKTQTRRILKAPRLKVWVPKTIPSEIPGFGKALAGDRSYKAEMNQYGAVSAQVGGHLHGLKPGEFEWLSPYSADRLWVRETCVRFTGIPIKGLAWPTFDRWALAPDKDPYKSLLPKAGNEVPISQLENAAACVSVPSIHMPRWASRIDLEVVKVRVERLQDISEEDAQTEGILNHNGRFFTHDSEKGSEVQGYATAKTAFQSLWELINGPGSWVLNPWVWCIEFKRVRP
jgi:hypothetical protein